MSGLARPWAKAGRHDRRRHAIGWVIVGGMSLGTILTLFVVPTAYTLLARDRSKQRHGDEAMAHAHPVPGPAE